MRGEAKVTSDEELFGLFESSWVFLNDQWTTPTGPWVHLSQERRERLGAREPYD